MERKDVLFLCQFFYPEQNSSATLPFDTAKYLSSKGLSVGALVGYPKEYNFEGDVSDEEIVEGVKINRLKYLQLKRTGKIGRLINYFSFTFRVLLNLSKLKHYKSVIVYSNPPVLPLIPVLAKKRYGTKIIFVAYDVYPEVAYASNSLSPNGLISRVMTFINHSLYKNVDYVVALTDEMKSFLLCNRPELSSNKITVIANWAHEKKRYADECAYKRFGYEDGQFIVTYFGNMGTCQDVETLLGAIKILKDDERIKFLIVGHGNKKERVIQETRNYDNVQVLDFLTGRDFEQAVAISSISVVSLERGLKGTCAPSKYYSYLQGGQPVLAIVEKDSYLAEEVTKEECGYAIEIGDDNSLAQVILDLVENREKCYKMGSNAETLYREKYDYLIAMKKYYDAVMNVL